MTKFTSHFVLLSCLLVLATAPASAQDAVRGGQGGLQIEVIADGSSVIASAKTKVFIHLNNLGKHPLQGLRVTVYLPDFILAECPNESLSTSGGPAKFRETKLEPYGHKTYPLLLTTKRRAPFEAFSIIVQAKYFWFSTAKNRHGAQAFKAIPMKAGPMEEVGVSGITLSIAVYILPGLLALIAFGLFVPLTEAINENKYLVGFLLSAGFLLLLQLGGLYNPRHGIWLGDLLMFTAMSAAAGTGVGFFVKRRIAAGQPLSVRYPADPQMSMCELLATYVQQSNSLKATPDTIQTGGRALSALVVETKERNKIILLPRKYELAGNSDTIRPIKDAYEKDDIPRFAKLLSSFSGELTVIDFIQGGLGDVVS